MRNREFEREKRSEENKTTTNQKERDEKLTSFGVTNHEIDAEKKNAKSRNRT
jgi:hypothetical protein